MDLKENLTRVLAVAALALATVVVIVVVLSSLPEGSDDSGKGGNRQQKASGSDENEKFYTVQPGDSFSTIAEEVGVPQETLESLNPDLDPQALAPGQQVRLR